MAAQREAEAGAASWRLGPSLAARASLTRNQYSSEATLPPVAPGAPPRSATIQALQTREAGLEFDLPVVDPASWARAASARSAAVAADAHARDASLQVQRAVARAYYDVLASDATIAAALHTLAADEENLRFVSRRAASGTVTALEVDRAAAEVQRGNQTLADARYQAALALRSLESLTGVPPEPVAAGAPVLADDLHDEAPLADWEGAVGGLPAVQAAAREADSAAQDARAAQAAMLPVVAVSSGEHFTNAPGFGHSPSWSVGLSATWRFDLALPQSAQAESAASDAAQARSTRARLDARDRIHQAWQETRALTAKDSAARAQADAAEHAARLARERYAAGTATQLEVVQGIRDAHDAQVSRLQAEADLAYSRAALRLAAGRPLTQERPGGRR